MSFSPHSTCSCVKWPCDCIVVRHTSLSKSLPLALQLWATPIEKAGFEARGKMRKCCQRGVGWSEVMKEVHSLWRCLCRQMIWIESLWSWHVEQQRVKLIIGFKSHCLVKFLLYSICGSWVFCSLRLGARFPLLQVVSDIFTVPFRHTA